MFLSIPRHTKGNQGAGQSHARIGASRVVQTLYSLAKVNTQLLIYNKVSNTGIIWIQDSNLIAVTEW